jgi:hypothetical protein
MVGRLIGGWSESEGETDMTEREGEKEENYRTVER